jgi:hypothetical protein
VDHRAHEVVLSYVQKFKKLDCLFAEDVVSDGTSDIVGPFETVKTRFLGTGDTSLHRLVWGDQQGPRSSHYKACLRGCGRG